MSDPLPHPLEVQQLWERLVGEGAGDDDGLHRSSPSPCVIWQACALVSCLGSGVRNAKPAALLELLGVRLDGK